jgi:hypothetical protein
MICRRCQHFVFKLTLCGVSVWLLQLPVLAAQSVVLSWIPSSDTNVVGYGIYSGTASRNYASHVTVGKTNSATISGLADGVTYYFAATSINSAGKESPFSNEAVYTTPSAAASLKLLPGSAGQFSFSVSGVSGYQYIVHFHEHQRRQTAKMLLPDGLLSAWLRGAVASRQADGIAGIHGTVQLQRFGNLGLSICRSSLHEPGQLGFRADEHGAVHFHGHKRPPIAEMFLPDVLSSALNWTQRPVGLLRENLRPVRTC